MARVMSSDKNDPAQSEKPTKRSLTLRGHRTSVSLEPCFWEALRKLAGRQGRSINDLAAEIDAERVATAPGVSLASALRTRLMKAALDGRLGPQDGAALRDESAAGEHKA